MRWTVQQLQTFRIFAETLSMTETSRRTFVTQSAVSQKLKELEHALKMKLFYRKGNKVLLTQEGAALLPSIELVFDEMNRMERHATEIRSAEFGELSLVTMPPLLQSILPDAVAETVERHPGLRVSVEAHSAPEILSRIRREVADVGFTFSVDDDTGVHLDPFMSVQIVSVMRKDNPLAKRRALGMADLARGRTICHAPNTPIGRKVLAALGWPADRPGQIFVNGSAMAIELAARGVGIALTHPLTIGALAHPDLAIVPLRPAVTVTLMMVVSRARLPSAGMRTLIDSVRGISKRHAEYLRRLGAFAEIVDPQ